MLNLTLTLTILRNRLKMPLVNFYFNKSKDCQQVHKWSPLVLKVSSQPRQGKEVLPWVKMVFSSLTLISLKRPNSLIIILNSKKEMKGHTLIMYRHLTLYLKGSLNLHHWKCKLNHKNERKQSWVVKEYKREKWSKILI